MTRKGKFQPWVPEHIRELLQEWGWESDGRWITEKPQQLIAFDLATNASSEAKLAWKFFDWRKYELIYCGRLIDETYAEHEASKKRAAQQSFAKFLYIADTALNRYQEIQVLTDKRLNDIRDRADELAKLISGIEHLVPHRDAGWYLGPDGDRINRKVRGWEINAGVIHLRNWARDYEAPTGIGSLEARRLSRHPDSRLRWVAQQMLYGNRERYAKSLAALINFTFRGEIETKDGGISPEIIRARKL